MVLSLFAYEFREIEAKFWGFSVYDFETLNGHFSIDLNSILVGFSPMSSPYCVESDFEVNFQIYDFRIFALILTILPLRLKYANMGIKMLLLMNSIYCW